MPPIDWKLLARHFAGETSAEEDRLLAAWGASRPRRRRLLDLLRRVWGEREARPDVAGAWQRVAVRAGITAPRARRRPRRFLPAAAAAALALTLLSPSALRQARSGPEPTRPVVYTTASEESATLRLRDGTVVRLGPASTLRVSAVDEREVWLEGRAFFAVRSNPADPFVAHTRGGSARVLGTRFVLDAEGDSVSVAVMEGRVALLAGGAEVEVGAGASSRGAFGSPPSEARPANVRQAAAWMGDVLIFQETSLADAAREIGRVYGVHVRLEDAGLEARTLSAVFHEQPLERVVTTVCRVIEVRCSTSGDTVRIRN
jgi:transmembrane sensor